MQLQITKLWGRFISKLISSLFSLISYQSKTLSTFNTEFLISCKIVSSISSAVDSVIPRKLAQNKWISITTSQNLSKPPYIVIRDYALQEGHEINSSCSSIIHKSEIYIKVYWKWNPILICIIKMHLLNWAFYVR